MEATRTNPTVDGYDQFEALVASAATGQLFRTDADPDLLWAAYLDNLPEANRQYYNCRACRQFIERFGGLVWLDKFGWQHSPFWSVGGPAHFRDAIAALCQLAERARVTGAFLSSDAILGTPVSRKGWTHLHAANANPWAGKVRSASQREAELIEDFRVLARSLEQWTRPQVETALAVLKSGHLSGDEKGVPMLEWYLAVRTFMGPVSNHRQRRNMLWKSVAEAPPGFAHLKNTTAGTLLDDVASGLSFDAVKAKWDAKLHPLKYQRPQAAPTGGQIDAAEKLVEKLGIAASFKRRFAALDDVRHVLWRPSPAAPIEAGGVFGHLRNPPAPPPLTIPSQKVTWAKFVRDALPDARTMEVLLPSLGSFIGVTTAEDPDAPPILQWDREGDRNPVSWYFYHGGSTASRWGVVPGWNPVAAVFAAPHGNELAHRRKFLVFAVAAMHDSDSRESCLFPELLRAELREVRSVIEAHSKTVGVSGTGGANGLAFDENSPVTVRVDGRNVYTIDRWD